MPRGKPSTRRESTRRTPRAREAVVRPCLRCGHSFPSEGPHNRLCNRCRGIDVSPFEP